MSKVLIYIMIRQCSYVTKSVVGRGALTRILQNFIRLAISIFFCNTFTVQGCALTAPGRLRRLTFGLGRLKKKSGRPPGRLDFGLWEKKTETNPANLLKGNGMKQKEASSCSCAPVSPINKSAESAVQFNSLCDLN